MRPLKLYFFLILHQTATCHLWIYFNVGCISSLSYIKPQHDILTFVFRGVVFLPYPTSNRNWLQLRWAWSGLYFFLILHQTATKYGDFADRECCISSLSYIKPQLYLFAIVNAFCCISSLSYIKPQLVLLSTMKYQVVFLPYPTSNRNPSPGVNLEAQLYFFLILHQTATSTSCRPKS